MLSEVIGNVDGPALPIPKVKIEPTDNRVEK